MAVTLIDEIRAAEKTAEEIREAAVDEAREIAKRAQAALAEWERAKPWHSGFARGKSARRARRTPLRRGAALSGRR